MMIRKTERKYPLRIVVIIALGFLVGACELVQDSDDTILTPQGTFLVDPLFQNFYAQIGGDQTVGPVISILQWRDHQQIQYVEAGLMVYDPLANPNYYLDSVGLTLGYSDPPVSDPVAGGGLWIGGHIIYHKFIALYQYLGGAAVVGLPLTDVVYNEGKGRFEQHFENLGFYILADSTESEVHLLAYGVYKCDLVCHYYPDFRAIVYPQIQLPEPFQSMYYYLGSSFVGQTLTEPYLTAEGLTQVIFDNLVMVLDPNNPNNVFALPIVELVGFDRRALVEPMNSSELVFFMIENSLGHNIPIIITNYLAQHGGLDIAGDPISDIFMLQEGVYRQCFTNLCLDYRPNMEENLRIKLSPMGSLYRAYFYNPISEAEQSLSPQEIENIEFLIWENFTPISSDNTMVALQLALLR